MFLVNIKEQGEIVWGMWKGYNVKNSVWENWRMRWLEKYIEYSNACLQIRRHILSKSQQSPKYFFPYAVSLTLKIPTSQRKAQTLAI